MPRLYAERKINLYLDKPVRGGRKIGLNKGFYACALVNKK